ncbi:LysR family transcriptional regulator [Vibrio breoganii]|uniref:LysR family transcriptional regulator n=1 Tax=Vibrio breoganii TaxID=553239 RepID=A0ABX1U7B2_9VIBR|nr:LysR family transcriptional regulator [Vibrio breoganii]NMO72610.1 LysR family transcriptional regulator [Vibrio breoganii]NMR69156.1 LysR family transcriptional regulator [Vibrio breoganii]OCH73868.1 LysR family transcriptional regulator [Vibrio breoganii]PMF98845.1 LysR family transcriptional regulator [Vibrio breoganii]PMG02397.1 LysR family transcriptional regulator [Vibrio breoganii]
MDKLSDMAMFVSIVKQKSMAGTARELGVSAASITTRLKALEDRYGVKLLNRTTRHLSLTEAGELYYRSCLDILDSVSETESLIKQGTRLTQGPIKIVAPKDISKQILLPIISEFTERYPEITPSLYLNDHVHNIADSGVDLVIRYGELHDSNIISKRLGKSERVLCASPQYLKDHGVPNAPRDLMEHNALVMLSGEQELKTWYFRKNSKLESVAVKPKMLSDDGEIIKQLALNGQGIAMKSRLDVQSEINSGQLVTVLGDYTVNFNSATTDTSTDLKVYYLDKKYQPKRIRLFLDFLYERFAEI